MLKTNKVKKEVCRKSDSQLLQYWNKLDHQIVTDNPKPLQLGKFVLKKTTSGITINGIKIKHIPSAAELVDSVNNEHKKKESIYLSLS